QPELAQLDRLDPRGVAGELLDQPHLVTLQLADQDWLPVDSDDRRDQPRLRIEPFRRHLVRQPHVETRVHLGVFLDERGPEPRDERTLLRSWQRLDALDRHRTDMEEPEDRAPSGRYRERDANRERAHRNRERERPYPPPPLQAL